MAKRKGIPRIRQGWKAGNEGDLDLVYLPWGAAYPGDFPQPVQKAGEWRYFAVCGGSAVLLLPGRAIELRKGDAFILGRDVPRGVRGLAGVPVKLLAWCWRNPPLLPALKLAPDQWLHFRLAPAVLLQLSRIHAACFREGRALNALSAWELRKRRLEIELILARVKTPNVASANNRHYIALARRWLSENLCQPDPVAGLSNYLNLSLSMLERLFAQHAGKPPRRLVLEIKMGRARELLRTKSSSVKAAAFSLGYQQPGDFSRAYKRFFGYPPKRDLR